MKKLFLDNKFLFKVNNLKTFQRGLRIPLARDETQPLKRIISEVMSIPLDYHSLFKRVT